MNTVVFVFCVSFLTVTYPGATGNNEDNRNEEAVDMSSEMKNQSDSSLGEQGQGPPDSHEAMNTRELKPTLTTAANGSDRKKRSYHFLMGLVKRNNSNYEITNEEQPSPPPSPSPASTPNVPVEAEAGELLLELIVRIAENPAQWRKVHDLLRKIDVDLTKSKQIVENIIADRRQEGQLKGTSDANGKQATLKGSQLSGEPDQSPTPQKPESAKDIRKLDANRNKKNASELQTTTYPWQIAAPATRTKNPYQQKNFAYHRVTGNPLSRSPLDKNPRAYIAVSVIAPKPIDPSDAVLDELNLENELKELKPWTHHQNLENMEQIRSRWLVRSDDDKLLYTP